MSQEIYNGNGNVQIKGDGNQVSFGQSQFQPSPDNPNLITCPACGIYGVFHGADQCPTCHYSFLNERLRTREEIRRRREKAVTILIVFAVFTLVVASQIPYRFEENFLKRIGWGALIVFLMSWTVLYVWARLTTWYKFRNR